MLSDTLSNSLPNRLPVSLPGTMKTIEFSEPGGPEVLKTGSRPLPEVGGDHVLVKVTCAGVNGPDMMQRRGLYPPPEGASDLLGLELSGEVVATGSSVSDWQIGDRLCALTNGGAYAEYVAVDARHCVPIPIGVREADAAGLPETFFTVWSNCFHPQRPAEGALLLVHGGAGGIGSTAIQLGAALGLRVFTTCGSEEDATFCRSLGAECTINYKDDDFVAITRKAGGADLILDIIGGDYIARNIKAAKADARIVQLAFRQGSKVEIDLMPIMLKRLSLTGSTLRSRKDVFKATIAADLRAIVWPLFGEPGLRTLTHCVLPFKDAAEAHRMMESGSHRGKILLSPSA